MVEPDEPVFAAIDWQAAAGACSCSTTLYIELIFIAGEARAGAWCDEAPEHCELFDLPEAYVVITTIFLPLME